MRSSRAGAIPSELAWLLDTLDDYERRLGLLEAPSGESLGNTVAKLQALIADIQAQIDAWAATRWTNAQISAEIASPGNISPGNVSISGTLHVPNAYGFDITYTRRTAWWGNDGRAGYASSTKKKKTGVRHESEALLRLLDAEPKSFIYRPEIRRRTTLRINEGVDYMPAREFGLFAEELEELGLGAFVYHSDETGEPEGIEYSMLTVALLAIARAQRAELDEIREHVGMKRHA